jgi:hypothetical protein
VDAGDQLDPLAQHIERRAGLEGLFKLLEELVLGGCGVVGLQPGPFVRLRLPNEPQDKAAVQRAGPVIILRPALDITLPGDQPLDQVLFDGGFAMCAM